MIQSEITHTIVITNPREESRKFILDEKNWILRHFVALDDDRISHYTLHID